MRIWLVRHGESLGNVRQDAWSKIPDHLIPLTEFGMEQAYHAGMQIRNYYDGHEELKGKKIRLWYSPYLRTDQTKDGVANGLGHDMILNRNRRTGLPGWEDDRLREQDFGMFSPIYSDEEQKKYYPHEYAHFKNTRDHKGRYWAKAPGGESRADVCQRVEGSIETIMRDAKAGVEDVVVVTHGVTMRAFEKRFLHHDVEWFESEPNPKNCDVVLIEGDEKQGYKVVKMFKGLDRPPSLPKDHKSDPFGGWNAISQEFGLQPQHHIS
jgi:2,3-bisphosphoglycerate-dependent phosphoglycerate mutase